MVTAKKAASAKAPAPKKPAAKPLAGKAATKTALQAAKAAPQRPAAKAPKADKPKKPKLVRDSFTIPKSEYAVLAELKQRSAKFGAPAKKSEVLRAGIKALAAMEDAAFAAVLGTVPALKTGRPAQP